MLQIPPSPLSINKILISSRALNLLPTILLSRRINHKKERIIQVYFTIDISDYNARSEEPIASSSHSRDIASRFLHALRLRRTGFTFRTKLAFIGPRIGRAVSIPVEPIFNGFITPAPSIEFFSPLLFSWTRFGSFVSSECVRLPIFLRILRVDSRRMGKEIIIFEGKSLRNWEQIDVSND